MQSGCSSEKVSDEFLCVNSCNRQYLSDRDHSLYRKNGRVDYHILYIEQGCCHVKREGQTVTAQSGSLILFRPGEPHHYHFYAAEEPVSCYIHFSGTHCQNFLQRFGFGQGYLFPVGLSGALSAAFTKMAEAFQQKGENYDALCAAYLLEFLALAGRKLRARSAGAGSRDLLMEQAAQNMQRHCREALCVQDYADMCHLSVSRFSHRFKEFFGEAPHSYLNRLRVEKAKQILCDTDYSMSEVAELVGFSDQNYFARIFKKYTGIPPLRYAKEYFG